MYTKSSKVNPQDLTPQLLFGLLVADSVYRKHGQELVVTSMNDSKHSLRSLHYTGNGADLRTWWWDSGKAKQVADEIREILHDDYDVVVEKDHIHLEYDPK